MTLRERTRRAVQAELVEAAQELFAEHGYEATTVDHIAAAAGISKRSFFRYFASKEEVVLGKYDLSGEQLLSAFSERPLDEPLWTSLRRMFDGVLAYAADAQSGQRMDLLERVISSTPSLRAAYLGRLDTMQQAIVGEVRRRAELRGDAWAEHDPTPEAVVGAAFACVAAARAAAATGAAPFTDLVDAAMAGLRDTSALT